MTLCSVCGVILKHGPGPRSDGLCLIHYFAALVRDGLASEREKAIFARMDRGWRGRVDRQRVAKLKSESEARLLSDTLARWGADNWRNQALCWLVEERNALRRRVEGLEAVRFIEDNELEIPLMRSDDI